MSLLSKSIVQSLLSAAAFTLASNPSLAEYPTEQIKTLRQTYIEQFSNGFEATRTDTRSVQRYFEEVFRKLDPDGDGIDQHNLDMYQKLYDAEHRLYIMGRYLPHDLNGDAIVTKEEVTQSLLAQERYFWGSASERSKKSFLERRLNDLFEKDPNWDGRIEMGEYAALLLEDRSTKALAPRDLGQIGKILLSMDPDKDGKLTGEEGLWLTQKAFTNTTLKSDREWLWQHQKFDCTFPAIEDGAQLVLMGAYKGDNYTNVTITGQDKETKTGKIRIEPGSEKIYLIVASRGPLILQVEGATERLSHLLFASRADNKGQVIAGVTGISKDKVTFTSEQDCIPEFSKNSGRKTSRALQKVADLFDRAPNRVISVRSLRDLTVPSGNQKEFDYDPTNFAISISETSLSPSPQSNGSQAIRDLKKFNKLKPTSARNLNILLFNNFQVDSLAKEKVISPKPVVYYGVLPNEAGIAQLLGNGSLQIVGNKELLIQRKMRFPAGLGGAHGKTFIWKNGVPKPTGDLGHSCVYSEGKRKVIAGNC